jgi:hypothetical protein
MGLGGPPLIEIVGFWPGVTHVLVPNTYLQCEACEYAGCICVVIVVPVVTAIVVAACPALGVK